MARAYSYIRFSSPAQALGDSLRRQVEKGATYCLKHDLDLDESLRDEGLSGYHGAHKRKGALGRFLARVEAGEIPAGSVLIVEAFDRLSRQTPRMALNQFLDLINAGIAVVTLIDEQRFDKTSVDANVGQLFLSIGMMMGAHIESANKAVRVKAAWVVRRDKVDAVCPAWLKPNADRTAFDVKEERVAVIERIFRMCIDGIGLDRIAFILNSEQVPGFGKVGWVDTYIRKLITSRLTRGEMALGEIDDHVRKKTNRTILRYPAVISEATWHAANDALAARRRSGGRYTSKIVNLFGTLCVCQSCGGRMRIRAKGRSPVKCNYLQCNNAKRGLCLNRRYYNYDRLESLVLKLFGSVAYIHDDQTAAQTELQNRIATARHDADKKAIEYKEAHRIARRSPGKLADEALAEAQGEHTAKLKEIDDLENQYRRLAGEPHGEQKARIDAMILDMGNLTGDARLKLRQKLSADLKKLLHEIVFKANGGIHFQLFGPRGVHQRVIVICEPPPDAPMLNTAQEVMDAIEAGHLVGMGIA